MAKHGQGREGVLRRLGVGERLEVPRGEHRRWDEAKSRVARKTGRRFHSRAEGDRAWVWRVV